MVSRSGHLNRRRKASCHQIRPRLEPKLHADGLDHHEGGIQIKQFRRILRGGHHKSTRLQPNVRAL